MEVIHTVTYKEKDGETSTKTLPVLTDKITALMVIIVSKHSRNIKDLEVKLLDMDKFLKDIEEEVVRRVESGRILNFLKEPLNN